MNTDLAPTERIVGWGSDDDLDHTVCCDENIALCGRDVTDEPWVEVGSPNQCVVCEDLWDQPCVRCDA